MKRFAVVLVGLVILIAAVSASAQMAPTPAPELKKLDYFAGTWEIEATIPPGPWGGGGKFTTSGTNEWQQGNFFILGQDKFTLPSDLGGGGNGTTVTGYDPDKKVYTHKNGSTVAVNTRRARAP